MNNTTKIANVGNAKKNRFNKGIWTFAKTMNKPHHLILNVPCV